MERGFKYRIYPNACQREQIARTLGCCRFVYNRALDVKKSAYAKTGKTVSWAELSRMLPAWKRARRDEKPSDRYLKQRKRVARIHAKIADARTDALHKVTTMLADENQVLCMEDLNAKGMVRNHHLAKAVSDASFGEFARLLEYKCAERGRTLVKVGRFYPSSKTCSACGHRLDALPLSVRVWDCPACGAHHDRDVNAARNILAEGKRVLSNTEGTAGHAGTVAAVPA